MKIIDSALYKEDIKRVADACMQWEQLRNKSIMVSGSTGLIGSFFIDVIMYKNYESGLNCKVYALGRNEKRAKDRFGCYYNNPLFYFIQCDINKTIELDNIHKVDYIIHLASNTHPVAYSTDPIGTIATNVIGTFNLLEYATKKKNSRFVFASSNEIYGENRGDVEKFDELYCGYIDCNTIRAGYPESKRCGEALCQAYMEQEKLDISIARITRSYGPTLLSTDTKALSQFLYKAIANEDIVLKSDGNQYYSYLYVADTVLGLIMVLLQGKSGEAYNIADEKSDIRLKDLAQIVADYVGKSVVYELPSINESIGYSKVKKSRLDNTKLINLGWNALYDIRSGVERTLFMLKEITKE